MYQKEEGKSEAENHQTDLESFENLDSIKENTGENEFEDYCNNYEGELTKKDFIELAKEF
ncbi:MAG TPA: hypothetical protein VK027_03735 [Chitinophagaceae bacterium]|nr:hypothetical protein [Chitinophagaceae bacterium]